ncbi:hypothetical protein CXF83_08520 [Shewanella sp. Choline-02u-19]|uniref:hypothetical protein n=1 Tax=unclassified Shewanella TaxID=196818 RepID=UPI000C3244BB|nr:MULTISPECIES: hypothetical protein [unclassified Shewanella]PKH61687.1 hypothetical protein CXF84_01490 [Shewanella sp. Bg11-22]PKI26777.1 hypothetical protein CXF83_08520 [Shewanella sp. Choline-02u-19]
MFAYIKYRKELHFLKKRLAKLEQGYVEVEKSYDGKDDQGHLSHLASQQHDLDMWIEYRKTSYFKNKADSLLIPMPSETDTSMYTNHDFGDKSGDVKILTLNGIHYLSTKIREEQKATREVIAFYFTIFTGLIGATIGLVSVLKT